MRGDEDIAVLGGTLFFSLLLLALFFILFPLISLDTGLHLEFRTEEDFTKTQGISHARVGDRNHLALIADQLAIGLKVKTFGLQITHGDLVESNPLI